MEIGVVLDILWPLERIERLAAAADAAGFDQVWVSDHPLGHDPFLTLLHLAPRLTRIRLGLGTINPSARHPAVIAASSGLLNHLIGGRFTLGIGSSINPLLHPIVRESAIAGTLDECVDSLAELSRAGITQLAIRFPEQATIRAVGEHVLPRLRERR